MIKSIFTRLIRISIPKFILLTIFFSIVAILLISANKNLSNSKITSRITRDINLLWGKPAKTMFPSISNPKYISTIQASEFLTDDDILFRIYFGKESFVYPAIILSYHHIVNDEINKQPFAVTYCLLTDTPIIYNRRLDDKIISLGVLGPLYFGNLVMYDTNTDSYITQLTGEIIYGPLKGKSLSQLFSVEITNWKSIKGDKSLHVLSPVKEMKFYRDFYSRYLSSGMGLHALKKTINVEDLRLDPYTKGIGINNSSTIFVPLTNSSPTVINNSTFSNAPLLIYQNKKRGAYRIFSRLVDDKVLTFDSTTDGIIDRETKTIWSFDGKGLKGPYVNLQLIVPQYVQAYWFSWSAFYPDTAIVDK
jgi:hypothetical protein